MRETRPNQPERYDAIVVGARVAGASTAMLMARHGLRVLMVDRRRPGSDTLSTHALMRGGVLQLQRWGLLERVKETGARPVRKTTFHYGDTVEAIDLKPSAGVEALYAPRRNVLDSILVEAAADAGVDIRFGVTVQDLITDSTGRVVGIAARTNSGTPLRATAPITIGADGMRSLVARQAGAAVEHQGHRSERHHLQLLVGEDLGRLRVVLSARCQLRAHTDQRRRNLRLDRGANGEVHERAPD